MKFVCFDLEITKVVPDSDQLLAHLPLGISVAATKVTGEDALAWYDADFAPKMGLSDLMRLLGYLHTQHQAGIPIVTWNGAGFDFLVMAKEFEAYLAQESAADIEEYIGPIRTIARTHIDPAFQMFCEKGYMAGLNKAARGMGFEGKPGGMHGALAPILWAQGYEQKLEVINYCKADVEQLELVYRAMVERGYLSWTSNAGNRQVWHLRRQHVGTPEVRLLTVEEALPLPVPDWPKDQKPRDAFVGWALPKVAELESDPDAAVVDADGIPF